MSDLLSRINNVLENSSCGPRDGTILVPSEDYEEFVDTQDRNSFHAYRGYTVRKSSDVEEIQVSAT